MFGRCGFQLHLCGAVRNSAERSRESGYPYRGHRVDFSSPGRRGFLTSPIGSVQLILKSTIIRYILHVSIGSVDIYFRRVRHSPIRT